MNAKVPAYFRFTIETYFLGLLFFALFRLAGIMLNWDLFLAIPEDLRWNLLVESLILGFRFDTIASVYCIALPFLMLGISSFFKTIPSLLSISSKAILLILYSLAFFISAADIPYFLHFNSRLTSASLMWMDEPRFVIQMISQEPSYWLAILPFIATLVFFYRWIKNRQLSQENPDLKDAFLRKLSFLLLGLALLFFGLRGRVNLNKAPLGPVDAYFSDYSIANQMALNPSFTFLKSYIDGQKKSNLDLDLMDSDHAMAFVQSQLNRSGIKDYPLAEKVSFDTAYPQAPNVVLIMMEGLSAIRMQAFGSQDSCTPFLDSLAKEGRFFMNAYSAGIHTHNGIYGILTGFPALFERHAMKQIPIPRYHSLPYELKKHGYHNTYFTNHDVEFDNVGGFLVENGVERLVSDRNYPPEKLLSTLGVPDDYMFRYSQSYLTEMAANGKPFLAMYMTTSNHKPFHFPDYYQRRYEDKELDAYAYADWSLKQFMNWSKKQDWYENTLFVFVADHGWAIQPQYDLSINHSHVPLLFFSPKYIEPKKEDKMAGHIDVLPSIMGLLKLPYINNSLGIDLFQDSRPYIYFNGDNKMGVIDQKYLYIYRKNGPESLHEYPGSINEISTRKPKADSMKFYGFSHLQVASDLIKQNRLRLED